MISSLRFRELVAVVSVVVAGLSVALSQQNLTPVNPPTHEPAASSYRSNTDTDLGRVSPNLALDDLRIVLKRSPEEQQALDILLIRQNQQGDPLFHAWLSPAEFGETFGVAEEDLATIREWLVTQGFVVGSVHAGEMVFDLSGSVG
jgi:subtilase family serine protease